MSNDFTYFAFISYSHKDQKWAEWIQRAIEHYKLPAIIRKEVQKPLPKRIAPIFRDATDLGVDVLVDGLHEELEKSRFLIVVCSPNSAKPNAEGKHFVDEEVRHFCDAGRAKQIIPVIVEGTPQESFGPVLKSKEILALDATKQSKARILNDIVAKILGLKPDVLWRRAERERRKQRTIRSILCGVLAFFVAFAGYFTWDANRTVKNYYADYVDSFGLPEGIFPLKKSELSHRHIHYRFEYKGFQYGMSPHADSADWCIWSWFGFRRRLVRVVQANSHGYPRKWNHAEYSDRPQIQDFKYDRDLRLMEIRCGRYNGEGREPYLEKRIELSNARGEVNGLMEFFFSNERLDLAFGVASVTTVDRAKIAESSRIEITKHFCKRDGKGRITQCLFLNNSIANVKDGDGLHGFSYEYDEMGRPTVIWYLGRNGEEFCHRANKQGVAGKQFSYTGHNVSKEEYLDESGNPILKLRGWGASESSFDNYDRLIKICFLGTSGGEVRREYDTHGNKIREVYFGIDGKRAPGSDGCAEFRWECDERGNITKMTFYGVDGKPILTKSGFAAVRMEHDENGNRTRQSYLGVDGMPISHKDGCSEVHWEYDVSGNKIMEAYFGVDGKPTLLKNGYAEVRMEYDERGNKTRRVFIGTNGKPTLHKDGFAEVRMKYNEYGSMTDEALFGVDDKPARDTVLGYAEMRMEYDGRGNTTKVSFFGVDGKPTLARGGFAERHFEYDEHGNVTIEQCFGVEGKPILCKDGYAETHTTYDKFGNVTKRVEFGVDGKPTRNIEYDEHGSKTNEKLFGIGGESTQGFEYDERGNMTKISFFGENGELMICNEIGCAELRTEYDERGNVTKSLFLGVDGLPTLANEGFAEKRTKYDERGKMTRVSFFGVKGEPVLCKDDYAELCIEYDERGNMTKGSYFGVDGKPTLNKKGCFAELRKEYDERGNVMKCSYFGVDGKLTLHEDGYAELRKEYDEFGNMTKESYFGIDGKPTLSKNCIAGFRNEYDERGNVTKTSYFGVDGKPTLHKNGYAIIRFAHNPDGTIAKIEYFDVSGKPIELQPVALSVEILSNSAAEKLRVKEGDIWCRLGSYDILKSEGYHEVTESIQASRNHEKELIVARKVGDRYEIHAFKFPVGLMGIRVGEKNLSDFDKLAKAYKAYCEQEKSKGNE